MPMTTWLCSTGRASWPTIIGKERVNTTIETGRLNRPPSASLWLGICFGLRPTPLPNQSKKSGQFMCYKTGQF
jgi:hypothetical protein